MADSAQHPLEFLFSLFWIDMLGCLVFGVPWWGPWILFGHLPRVDDTDVSRVRGYSIADLMALLTTLAVGNVLTFPLATEFSVGWLTASAIYVNLFFLLIWFHCQRRLAAHRITAPHRRLIMQVCLYPGAVILTAQIALTGAMTLIEVFTRLSLTVRRPRAEWFDLVIRILLDEELHRMIGSLLVAVVLASAIRRLFFRVILAPSV